MRSIEQAIKVNETTAQVLRVLRKSELDASGIEAVLDTVDATLTEDCDVCEPAVAGICVGPFSCDCAEKADQNEEESSQESEPAEQ